MLCRRHFHNHGPELHLPQPASPHVHLPPPPSFEEAAATLAPPLGPMKKVLEEYDTTMMIFDESKQEMVEYVVLFLPGIILHFCYEMI